MNLHFAFKKNKTLQSEMGKLGLICLSRNKNLSVSFQEGEKSRVKHIYFDISL